MFLSLSLSAPLLLWPVLQLFHKTLLLFRCSFCLGRVVGGVGWRGYCQRGSGAKSVFVVDLVVVVVVIVAIIAVAAALFKHNLMTAHYNR